MTWFTNLYKYFTTIRANKDVRANDPVYCCEVHKQLSCCHVDGYLCHPETCSILKEFRSGNKV